MWRTKQRGRSVCFLMIRLAAMMLVDSQVEQHLVELFKGMSGDFFISYQAVARVDTNLEIVKCLKTGVISSAESIQAEGAGSAELEFFLGDVLRSIA